MLQALQNVFTRNTITNTQAAYHAHSNSTLLRSLLRPKDSAQAIRPCEPFPPLETDIVQGILRHLPPHDLLAIAQTCSSFYNLALPILYEDIVFSNSNLASQNVAFWPNRTCVHSSVRSLLFLNIESSEDLRSSVSVESIHGFSSLFGISQLVVNDGDKIIPLLNCFAGPSFAWLSAVSFVDLTFDSPVTLLPALRGMTNMRFLTIQACQFGRGSPQEAPSSPDVHAFRALPITSLVLRHICGQQSVLYFCTAASLKSLELTLDGSAFLSKAERVTLYELPSQLERLHLVAGCLSDFSGQPGQHIVRFLKADGAKISELVIDAPPQRQEMRQQSLPAWFQLPQYTADTFPIPPLPELRSVEGCWQFLRSMLDSTDQLTKVAITDTLSVQDATQALKTLSTRSLVAAMMLHDLEMNISEWDYEVLVTASTLFPELRRLSIKHHGHWKGRQDVPPGEDFLVSMAAMRLRFLPHLERFELYNPYDIPDGREDCDIGFDVWNKHDLRGTEFAANPWPKKNAGVAATKRVVPIVANWAKSCPELLEVRLDDRHVVRRRGKRAVWERFEIPSLSR